MNTQSIYTIPEREKRTYFILELVWKPYKKNPLLFKMISKTSPLQEWATVYEGGLENSSFN